jgi:argininosuccinate synthase
MPDKIVLAFSGGLDTTVAVRWLQEAHDAEVIALLVDVGQGADVEAARRRAEQAGASEIVVADCRREFAEQFCLPVLRAGALYERRYPLVSALSRPLIAAKQVEVAREHGADAVAHGCTGKGNDQVRFEVATAALAPDLVTLAPVRDWAMTREAEIAYATEHGIEVPVKSGSAYSVDQNLWGRSIEAGPLEDPWVAPPEDCYAFTRSHVDAPDEPQEVIVRFVEGVPVAIDGEELPLDDLILRAAAIAGEHGVGRLDNIENRLVGIKSREVYEVPAAALLMTAHRGVEEMVLDRDLQATKFSLADTYATLVYNGLWYGPHRAALDAFVEETQHVVTGEARVRLHKGSLRVVGRRADQPLYDFGLATYEEGDAYQHDAAVGFIHVFGLSTRVWAARQRSGAPAPAAAE